MHVDQCSTRIGQLTGLEPRETVFHEFPQPSTYADRNVEGCYLLHAVPSGEVLPKPVAPGCNNALNLALTAINEYYPDENNTTRLWWARWRRFYSDSIAEYMRNHPFDVPFIDYTESEDLKNPDGALALVPQGLDNFGPDVRKVLAMACPSVRMSFQGRGQPVPDPRIVFYNEDYMRTAMTAFEHLIVPTVTGQINAASGNHLAQQKSLALLDRLATLQDATLGPRGLTVAKKAKAVCDRLRTFFESLHRREHIALQDVDDNLRDYATMVPADMQKTVSNITVAFGNGIILGIAVTRADLAQLSLPTMPFTDRSIAICMMLGNAREAYVARRASEKVPPQPWRRSLWLSPEFVPLLLNGDFDGARKLCHGMRLADLHFLFVPYRDMHDDSGDNYAGLAINLCELSGFIVVPTYTSNDAAAHDRLVTRKTALVQLFNAYFTHEAAATGLAQAVILEAAAVSIFHGEEAPNQYSPIMDNFSRGVALITIFDFLWHSCPVIITQQQWQYLRRRLAVALKWGRLPRNI